MTFTVTLSIDDKPAHIAVQSDHIGSYEHGLEYVDYEADMLVHTFQVEARAGRGRITLLCNGEAVAITQVEYVPHMGHSRARQIFKGHEGRPKMGGLRGNNAGG